MSKKVTIRHRQTGEIKTGVKRYGTGYIDAVGNFYHASQWQFVQEREV